MCVTDKREETEIKPSSDSARVSAVDETKLVEGCVEKSLEVPLEIRLFAESGPYPG
jgi:hypothetical protein